MTLLPDPLSPTSPSVSPRSTVNAHAADRLHDAAPGEELDVQVSTSSSGAVGASSTAIDGGRRYRPPPLTVRRPTRWPSDANRFSRSCGSSITRSQLLSRLTDEHRQAEQEARIDDQPLVAEQLVVAGAGDVETPRDTGVLDAEPEEAQRRLGEDDAGELEHGERGERGEQVGQHVLEHDPPRLAADHLGGLDERSLLDREHDAARHAGVDHPPVDGEDDGDRPRPCRRRARSAASPAAGRGTTPARRPSPSASGRRGRPCSRRSGR